MLDAVGMQKIEEKSKQFLIQKIIQGVKLKVPILLRLKKNPRDNRNN